MKYKYLLQVLGLGLVAVWMTGCATSRAPMAASGDRIEMLVISDRGDPSEMEERQWGYRNEVGSYMERDLINRLNRTGYQARLIEDRDKFSSAKDRYLISMAIKSYNPGSAAARMLVGFGAGACSLDMHYQVVGENDSVIMEWDDGIGTSGHWSRLPKALNDRLVRKLNSKLAEE